MPETVEAHYAAYFVRGWSIFIGAWAAVGGVLFVVGMVNEIAPLRIVGMIVFSVFLPLFFYARIRLIAPGPVIVVGPKGFYDRRLGMPVPWTAITALRSYRQGNRRFLMIEVEEPGRYLERAGPMAFFMQRLNLRMGFPVLGANLSGLDVPQDRIAAAAEGWWNAAGGVSPAR